MQAERCHAFYVNATVPHFSTAEAKSMTSDNVASQTYGWQTCASLAAVCGRMAHTLSFPNTEAA